MKTIFEVAITMTALVKLHVGTQDLNVWEAVVQAEQIIDGEHAIRKAEIAGDMLNALERIFGASHVGKPDPLSHFYGGGGGGTGGSSKGEVHVSISQSDLTALRELISKAKGLSK